MNALCKEHRWWPVLTAVLTTFRALFYGPIWTLITDKHSLPDVTT